MAAAGMSQQTAEVCSGFCHPPAESSPDTPSSLHAKPLTPPSGSPWFSKSLCAHQETLCHTAGFQIPSPPPSFKKCDSPVSNGDISFPTYSGSSWLCNTWGCGEKGGKSQIERSKKHSFSPPHRYVASPFQNHTIWDMLANFTGGKQQNKHIAEKNICTSSDAIRCQSGRTLHIP